MARAEAKRREAKLQEERIKAPVDLVHLYAFATLISYYLQAAAKHAERDSNEAPEPSTSTSAFDVKSGTLQIILNNLLNSFSCCIHFSLAVENIMRASQNALELEKRRQLIYEELSTKTEPLNQVYHLKKHSI